MPFPKVNEVNPSYSSVSCDVLVIGSGAAGMTAAITARKAGLEVLLVEKAPVYGGTTATSGATLWIPLNDHDAALGAQDSAQDVRTYLKEVLGTHYDEARIGAFLENASEMVRFLESETEVKFEGTLRPEYYAQLPGASFGRSIQTAEFDVRSLGPHYRELKRMLPQTLFLGIAVGNSLEMRKYFTATRSLGSFLFMAGRILRQGVDVLRFGRSAQLPRGAGLIGRLRRTMADLEIPLWLSSPARKPLVDNGKVTGALIDTPSGPVECLARRGVVLACGGFPADHSRRARTFPHARKEGPLPPILAPVGNTGDGIRFGEAAGGIFCADVLQPAAWVPVSIIPGEQAIEAAYPHFVDRHKPGFIAVDRSGRRFVNEAGSYHDFVQGMFRANTADQEVAAFLICDQAAINRWGMGFVKPAPMPRGKHIRSGYLHVGKSLGELAQRIGLDPQTLEATVSAFNDHARRGQDPDFGRGESLFDRFSGDQNQQPNPNLGPLDRAPFYAVKLVPGEIATFAGLKTDAQARVLGADEVPVPGLYAVGNDMMSLMGGTYPAAGITLGPGMTFAFIAARHIAAAAGAGSAFASTARQGITP